MSSYENGFISFSTLVTTKHSIEYINLCIRCNIDIHICIFRYFDIIYNVGKVFSYVFINKNYSRLQNFIFAIKMKKKLEISLKDRKLAY